MTELCDDLRRLGFDFDVFEASDEAEDCAEECRDASLRGSETPSVLLLEDLNFGNIYGIYCAV